MEGRSCTDLHSLSTSSSDSKRETSRKTLRATFLQVNGGGTGFTQVGFVVVVVVFLISPKFLGCD